MKKKNSIFSLENEKVETILSCYVKFYNLNNVDIYSMKILRYSYLAICYSALISKLILQPVRC